MGLKPISNLKPTTRFLLKGSGSKEIHASRRHSQIRKMTANVIRKVRRETGARGANAYVKATFGRKFSVNRKGTGSHVAKLARYKGGRETYVKKA